jgi:hypothetical protein
MTSYNTLTNGRSLYESFSLSLRFVQLHQSTTTLSVSCNHVLIPIFITATLATTAVMRSTEFMALLLGIFLVTIVSP